MKSVILSVLVLLAAVGAALIWRPPEPLQSKLAVYPPEFIELQPGVLRFRQIEYIAKLIPAPISTFLVLLGKTDWALVDAGYPSHSHRKKLVSALKEALNTRQGSLRVILCE